VEVGAVVLGPYVVPLVPVYTTCNGSPDGDVVTVTGNGEPV